MSSISSSSSLRRSCTRPSPRALSVALRGLLSASLVAGLACRPAADGASGEAAAERYRREIEGWRAERVARLTAPDGWLSVVELGWLGEGENRAGSGPDAAVVLPPDAAPPFVGSFERRGMEVSFRPAVRGLERIGGADENGAGENGAGEAAAGGGGSAPGGGPIRPGRSITMATDASGDPTVVALDGVRFYVIERGDRLGVRVKDPDSPARRGFQGIDSFPIDPAWRVEARLEVHDPPHTLRVPDIIGTVTEQPSPGTAVFDVDGRTYRLDAMSGGEGELFFVFGDRTNGDETYGGGRFLYAEIPAAGEPLVLDFNRAVNPPCAFTAFATCPLPPRGNKLRLAILAGERVYGGGVH